MEEYIYNSSNGLWYELHGDYYLPCLAIPEEEVHTIGIWGRRHQQYLREHRPMAYSDLVLCGKLHSYLADMTLRLESGSICSLRRWQRRKVSVSS